MKQTFSLAVQKSSVRRMRSVLLPVGVALIIVSVLLVGIVVANIKAQTVNNDETSSEYWKLAGQATLKEHLEKKYIKGIAKNVIFFLGDGMSIPTITAARIYSGQLKGHRGEEARLAFDKFPFTGLTKTYCIDRQVSDSACTATAYLCGVKANYFTIGVNGKVKENECGAAQNTDNHVQSLAALAQKASKATGIVTTTRVTHASPAGAYAHTSNRSHESDADVENISNPFDCRDIATQLVEDQTGRNLNVIFGGGRTKFIPADQLDEDGLAGNRNDGINLIDKWKKYHPTGQYIRNKDQLKNLNRIGTKHVLGLFASNHMDYNLDSNHNLQPTLKEMTEKAIDLLSENENGYFLFVEGGRIDHAHHNNLAIKALDETVQFSEAVQAAVDMTRRNDTLIVVTSDHSHSFTMNGYPLRGNNILGPGHELSEFDHMTYMTLSYSNGPGSDPNRMPDGRRIDPKSIHIDKDYMYPALVQLIDETHGGDDVGVFAIGPHADLFVGNYEQNVIPQVVAYASCLGDGLTVCGKT